MEGSILIFAGAAAVKGGEDEGGADSHAVTVVEKALEIFSLVSGVIKTSTRAGGHVRIYSDFSFIVCGETYRVQ
jgi:hypothetical protein